MQETGERQAKLGVIGFACHRGGHSCDPMIGVHSGDDLTTLRLTIAPVQHPQHLDHRVVRFGSGIGVIHLALVKRGDLDQFF